MSKKEQLKEIAEQTSNSAKHLVNTLIQGNEATARIFSNQVQSLDKLFDSVAGPVMVELFDSRFDALADQNHCSKSDMDAYDNNYDAVSILECIGTLKSIQLDLIDQYTTD
jgi:hypothetical protein